MSAVTLDAPAGRGSGSGAHRRPGVARLTKVELRKMTDTRAGFWLLTTTALLTVLAVVVLVVAGDDRDHRFSELLSVAIFPSAILLPVIGILLVTSEWTQRTTLVTFALVPQRSHVLVAKLVAGVLLSLAALVIGIVFAAIGTAVAAPDIDGTWSHAAPLIGQSAVLMVTAMVMGIGFGAALLMSAPAIVVYFALPMVFGILGEFSFFQDIAEWIDTTRTTGSMSNELLSGEEWVRALVSLGLWMGIPLAFGWRRVTKDEVR